MHGLCLQPSWTVDNACCRCGFRNNGLLTTAVCKYMHTGHSCMFTKGLLTRACTCCMMTQHIFATGAHTTSFLSMVRLSCIAQKLHRQVLRSSFLNWHAQCLGTLQKEARPHTIQCARLEQGASSSSAQQSMYTLANDHVRGQKEDIVALEHCMLQNNV